MFSHAEVGGGHNTFRGTFNTEACSFSPTEGAAQKVLPCLDKGGGVQKVLDQ